METKKKVGEKEKREEEESREEKEQMTKEISNSGRERRRGKE